MTLIRTRVKVNSKISTRRNRISILINHLKILRTRRRNILRQRNNRKISTGRDRNSYIGALLRSGKGAGKVVVEVVSCHVFTPLRVFKSHFGVTSPDARLQRPEYLGGNRIPVNINQVVQSSATQSSGTPLGDTAAFSVTTDVHGDFIKSFVEHGFVIGIMVARYDHTYQQGLERFWSRRDRLDYYFPVFANIGEQPILNKEIYAQGTAQDNEVFGYQEAWADYRYKPSRVAGQMRSKAPTSLDVWHLADEYTQLPKLSDAWIREDQTNVDRVLAVTSSVSNQMFADLYIQCKATRPMPVYSIPGLIDHH
jgi:hypothetical protein